MQPVQVTIIRLSAKITCLSRFVKNLVAEFYKTWYNPFQAVRNHPALARMRSKTKLRRIEKMKMSVKQLARGGCIAALYVALTLLLAPISFGSMQLRVSEILTVLPFVMPEAIWGLSIGCFISNILCSSFLDAVFGTLATLLAAICTAKIRKMWFSPLPAVIFNAVIVGAVVTMMSVEFTLTAYLLISLSIGVSQLIVCYCGGIPLLVMINKLSEKIDFLK